MVCSYASAQEKTVSGSVKNETDGSPISNASVMIKGTAIGTTTNENGVYSIKATENQTLVISAIGFAPVEQKIGNKSVYNFSLSNLSKEM